MGIFKAATIVFSTVPFRLEMTTDMELRSSFNDVFDGDLYFEGVKLEPLTLKEVQAVNTLSVFEVCLATGAGLEEESLVAIRLELATRINTAIIDPTELTAIDAMECAKNAVDTIKRIIFRMGMHAMHTSKRMNLDQFTEKMFHGSFSKQTGFDNLLRPVRLDDEKM